MSLLARLVRLPSRKTPKRREYRLAFEVLESRSLLANQSPFLTAGTLNNLTVLEDSGAISLGLSNMDYSAGAGEPEQTLTYTVTTIPSRSQFGDVLLENTSTAVAAGTSYTLAQLRGLQFRPADNRSGGPATFAFTVKDNGGTANGGQDTLVQSLQIQITPVNDAPSFESGPDLAVLTNAGPQSVTNWVQAFSLGQIESTQSGQFIVTNNTNPGLFAAQPAAIVNRTLTFTPSGATGSATITMIFQDNGGTSNGGIDTSAAAQFTIHVEPVTTAPAYSVVDLNPANFDGARGTGFSSPGVVAGYGDAPFVWPDGTAAGAVDLTPTIGSGYYLLQVNGAGSGFQVGQGASRDDRGRNHALLWSGTGASAVDLHSIDKYTMTAATDVDGAFQGGYGSPIGSGFSHALLWNGTPESVVDLHPQGYYTSQINGVGDGQQVGIGAVTNNPSRALLWSGTANSVVNLTPSWAVQAYARDIDDGLVVGQARDAVVWPTGTAAGVVTLPRRLGSHSLSTEAVAIKHVDTLNRYFIVGSGNAGDWGIQDHALLWIGMARVPIDLHTFLPSTFTSSKAYDVDAAGNVTGYAVDSQGIHAVLWKISTTAVNTAPERTSGAVNNLNVLQNTGTASLGLSGLAYDPSDPGQALTYRVSQVPSAALGNIYLTDGATLVTQDTSYTLAQIQGMKFQPARGAVGSGTFSFIVQDDGGTANGGSDTLTESLTITVDGLPTLTVAATPTAAGFTAQFSADLDSSLLNLYSTNPNGAGFSDVSLVGASTGVVRGSLAVGSNLRTITFIKTGGPLAPDTYTLTMRSAADGFKDTAGNLLDGNSDGTAGDNFVQSFVVATPQAGTVTVALPDFARGPGQSVTVPATGIGLPLTLSNAAGVTSVTLQIAYDPTLLHIASATVAVGLPAGATASVDTTTTPGIATVTFISPTPLSAGVTTFVLLQADVPTAAPYKASQVLKLQATSINGGTIGVVADDALQVVSNFGDASGDGQYTGFDASRISRVVVGLDTGFLQYLKVDPALIADINADGNLTGFDASRVARVVVGLPVPQIPALPAPGVAALPMLSSASIPNLEVTVSDGEAKADVEVVNNGSQKHHALESAQASLLIFQTDATDSSQRPRSTTTPLPATSSVDSPAATPQPPGDLLPRRSRMTAHEAVFAAGILHWGHPEWSVPAVNETIRELQVMFSSNKHFQEWQSDGRQR